MFSLRRALAVRYSVTMFFTLLIIGVWVEYGTELSLRQELDRDLLSSLGLETAALAAGHPIAFQQQWVSTDRFVDELNRFVVLRGPTGRIVQTNVSAAATLPNDSAAFGRALAGERAWATLRWDDRSVRTVLAPTPPGTGPPRAVLQIAASLEPLNRTSRVLFAFMLGTVVLATMASAAGAGWLARRTVRPVSEIAEQAAALDPDISEAQLTIHADVEEYKALVDVLNGMLTRLHGALASQRRIIDDVAHELRTPLTAIQGTLEVGLRSRATDEGAKRLLASCLEDVEHLASINEALLLMARLDAGHVKHDPRPTNLGGLAAERLDHVRARAGSRTLQMEAPSAPDVVVDAGLVSTALDQLLNNAIDHTPDGTHVRLTVQVTDREAELIVDDSGPGIENDDARAALFERFYRADEARTRYRGPGLGLTIAAAVLRLHDGTISAEHSPLGGLRIRCVFPVSYRSDRHHQE